MYTLLTKPVVPSPKVQARWTPVGRYASMKLAADAAKTFQQNGLVTLIVLSADYDPMAKY